MPSVTAAICPVFALKAKVDDQLVHLPWFFTWLIHRLLSESGLAIIIQRRKRLPTHWAFTSCHTVLSAFHTVSYLFLTIKFQSEHYVLPLQMRKLRPSKHRWGGGLTFRQYYFPEALSLAGAHRQVGTSAATVALGCAVKAVPWARPVYLPHHGSHGEAQVPEFPVPTSHRKVHLGLSSPHGTWQIENASVKLLVNLCALIGPLRKDILPGDELWRIPSRERLFQCVKRVCTAVLMASTENLVGFSLFFFFFSPRAALNKDSKDGI